MSPRRSLRAWLWLAGLLAALVASPAHAALTFSLRTGNNTTSAQSMIIDSNKCGQEGPRAMYVGGVITNTGAAAVDNIVATLSGLNANIFLAGGQPAAQSIGTLGAGESIGVYWFAGYGCTEFATAATTVGITSNLGSQNRAITLTIREAISASAGGNVLSATLGPGAVVGQTVYFDTTYDFGGSDIGDEFFLQPTGGQTFNAACFRLVGATITSSNVTGAPVGSVDRFYFLQTARQSGNGYRIGVRYSFEYQCAGVNSTARPYAVQTSGSSNIKYTGNFDGSGSISLVYPGATNPFTITKTVSSALAFVGAGTALTYTVTISNPSAYPSVISKIIDVLPAGVAFAALSPTGDVTAANSSSTPTAGATGTLTFLGKVGRSYAIPAGGSVKLIYTATRPAAAGSFTNTAQAHFGSATTPTAQATFQQVAIQPLTASKANSVLADPVNLAANPKAIPGATVGYSIAVANPNVLPIDSNSVIVTDRLPAGTKLCLTWNGADGTGPIAFIDGSTASAVLLAYLGLGSLVDGLEFSADGGATWTHLPTLDGDGCDGAITDFRARLTGAFAPGGSFTLNIRTRVR